MWFVSIVTGLFVGFLVDSWLKRLTVKDPWRLVAAVVVAVLVGVFTYTGDLVRL